MPSGGARARSGPAPDPDALRRDRPSDADTWTRLPAEGRQGDPPPWPLQAKPTAQEWRVWTQFWAKPQAIIWERDQIFEPVAMFVRQYIEGMRRMASAENRKTVRMMFADLYLTSDSLARARLRIAPDEVATRRNAPDEVATRRNAPTVAARPAGRSTRDRFKAINGGRAS